MGKLHIMSLINTHHVQYNENSGHRVAPQEDSQSDAEITRFFIYHWGMYFTIENNSITVDESQVLPETVNGAGCFTYFAIHPWTVLITEEDWCVSLPCC